MLSTTPPLLQSRTASVQQPSVDDVPVTITGIKRGYAPVEVLTAEISYADYFRPNPSDWIVIQLAGQHVFDVYFAVQAVPIGADESCGSQVGATDDKTPLLDKAPKKTAKKLKTAFDLSKINLAPRNFYQLAYVQRSTQDVLVTSSVFYVEVPVYPGMAMVSACDRQMRTSSTIHNFGPVIRHQPNTASSSSQIRSYASNAAALAAIRAKKPSWKSFLCGSSALVDGQWTSEAATQLLLPPDGNDDEDDYEDEGCDEDASISLIRQRSTSEGEHYILDQDGEDLESQCKLPESSPFLRAPRPSSSITQFLLDLWRHPFSAPSTYTPSSYSLATSSEVERRSASMYEIGANLYPAPASPQEPYQKMVCQLTHSNNNLLHENERLLRRVQQLEGSLRQHVDHIHSLYTTLFRNGISGIVFPDGEEIHLSQFRGDQLTLVKAKDWVVTPTPSPRVPMQKSVNRLSDFKNALRTERLSDRSSESSMSSGSVDQDELKAAMLKCITKSKNQSDIDGFVNWLNEEQPYAPQTQRKSHSLEEQLKDSMRIRQPLQRVPKVDRARSESEIQDPSETTQPSGSESYRPATAMNGTTTVTVVAGTTAARNKAMKHRAQSVAATKITGFLGSRRTSSCVRQSTFENRATSQRKSLANLSSLRNNHSKQPRRNLI